MRGSLEEEEFVLDVPRAALRLSPTFSSTTSTEYTSVRVSSLRRGIMAREEEERAGCTRRERLDGYAASDIVSSSSATGEDHSQIIKEPQVTGNRDLPQ